MRAIMLLVACLAASASAMSEAYKTKAEEWKKSTTREAFFREFNKDRDSPVTGPRADRLWSYVNEQLDHGGIVWKDGGAMVYALPVTHFIPLPDFFLDLLESTFKPFRTIYYIVMDAVHEDAHSIHHEWIEWLQENGVLPLLQAAMVSFLALSFLRWLIYRFTDGIWPSERKIAQKDRELAAAYKKKKGL
mmetsp:Transcript_29177/g.75088  ORF Transcript_29177/g.75088 Transcript_29177/m.75088 type:complete len:190 (-) Transcript_29177:1843-2412(-)|eukprot:CAMPEP_0115840144 /NCGR_PEP_ID=MMETSP0287-20121206/6619_1 /TAXON_ID=412157 /ORGANISM="Chrysochromulina rotalis, Strain UIO044" /LENGTH=189 /DNA_ID=CAMNT_0003293745 /DNA_START=84 /DNA_END=653 /DNA_ORIENTATION=+